MIRFWLGFITLLSLVGCSEVIKKDDELKRILQKQSLVFATQYGGHAYYQQSGEHAGFEYELMAGFAAFLDVPFQVKVFTQPNEMLEALEHGTVDIIASQFLFSPDVLASYKLGPTYQYFDLVVVSHNPDDTVSNLADLSGSLWLAKDSFSEHVVAPLLQQNTTVNWQPVTDFDNTEMLEKVALEDIDYTVVDSLLLNKYKLLYPHLNPVIKVAQEAQRRWILAPGQDDTLTGALLEYFGTMVHNGQLALLEEKYFGHISSIDYVDIREFLRAIESTLPKYRNWFEQYANGLDWRLLAALSYQESHWDPKAVSPTGVRGLMMLTRPTAKEVGIRSRVDAQQSIRGGSTYFKKIYDRLPARITDPDRIYFALAAYNLGLGHVEDARVLAQKNGLNPDYWLDVKQYLPKLKQKKYYNQTKFGYARGDVAVLYVENIRRYYESLKYALASNSAESSPSS